MFNMEFAQIPASPTNTHPAFGMITQLTGWKQKNTNGSYTVKSLI